MVSLTVEKRPCKAVLHADINFDSIITTPKTMKNKNNKVHEILKGIKGVDSENKKLNSEIEKKQALIAELQGQLEFTERENIDLHEFVAGLVSSKLLSIL